MSDGKVLELLGAPGAGKTTLLSGLVRSLQARGVPVEGVELGPAREKRGADGSLRSRPEWRREALQAVRTNPALAAHLLPFLLSDCNRRGVRRTLEMCRRDLVVRQMRARGGILAVDEGPVHRAACWLSRSPRAGDGPRVVRRITRPDVVLYVPVAPEVAVERIMKRRRMNTIMRMEQPDAVQAVVRYQELIKRLLEVLAVPMVTFDGDMMAAARDLAERFA